MTTLFRFLSPRNTNISALPSLKYFGSDFLRLAWPFILSSLCLMTKSTSDGRPSDLPSEPKARIALRPCFLARSTHSVSWRYPFCLGDFRMVDPLVLLLHQALFYQKDNHFRYYLQVTARHLGTWICISFH